VVGAALGLLLGLLWWALGRVMPAGVAAGVVVVADLALTNLLHVDGLADSADGLLPHLPPNRRLEVMAAPDVGAFGISAVAAVLLLRWTALSSLRPAPLLLGALWCLSRTAMAAVPGRLRYARPEGGLATAFIGRAAPAGLVVLATGAALALGGAWRSLAGPVALSCAGVGFAAVVVLAERRIGGYTGDVLGAAGMLAETIGLVVATVRW
jgi:adenosylcobinamide-GDP ribazoletransferase